MTCKAQDKKEGTMRKLSLLGFVMLLCFGTITTVQSRLSQDPSGVAIRDASQSTNAAYRDGLYLGSLMARRGSAYHPAVGRWATEADRAAFAAGYQQGYNALVASSGAKEPAVR